VDKPDSSNGGAPQSAEQPSASPSESVLDPEQPSSEEQPSANEQLLAALPDALRVFHGKMERARKSGKPLPAGGVFLMNREVIWLEGLKETAAQIARNLDIPPQAVVINAKAMLDMEPMVGVNLPRGYAPPGLVPQEKKLVEIHVQGVIRACMERFRERTEKRLKAWEVAK